MKKLLLFLMILLVAFTVKNEVDASSLNVKKIDKAYQEVISYADTLGLDYELSYDSFVEQYNTMNIKLDDLVQLYIDEFNNMISDNIIEDQNIIVYSSSSSSGGVPEEIAWQYNTGTDLPQQANYSTCNLVAKVEPGYIIYESEGFGGLTGHIAIVEGVYYSETYHQYYVRVIEAIGEGVSRSIVDCDRFDLRGGELYYVEGATEANRNNVVQYAVDQLGKDYMLDLDSKDCDEDDWGWYCSQLAYCAYMDEGIDIEVRNVGWFGIVTRGDLGVTPHDIIEDDDTIEISVTYVPSC